MKLYNICVTKLENKSKGDDFMFKQLGFIICVAMVAAAMFRPAPGLEYNTNMEMLVYGSVAVAACLWRDYRKDKRNRE